MQALIGACRDVHTRLNDRLAIRLPVQRHRELLAERRHFDVARREHGLKAVDAVAVEGATVVPEHIHRKHAAGF